MGKLASNNNKAVGAFTQKITSPSLVYYDGGTKWYYPLITQTGSVTYLGWTFSYDRSVGDTFGVALDNTKYVVPNKRVSAVTYDIPAGTYSPSAFKNLIDKYIYTNGSRRVANSFNVTVNGQTVAVTKNLRIWSENNESSGSSSLTYGVNFSGLYLEPGNCFQSGVAYSFSRNKVYITQSKGISYFGRYMYYNITVETGIKFI